MLLRSLLAAVLIVLLTAGASATAGLLYIDDLIDPDVPEDPRGPAPGPDIDPVEPPPPPGKPQTILLVGSDHRWADGDEDPASSDTLMLVRLNPKEKATTVLSLPRDLQVQIPGHGTAKINDAYAFGGPKLTAQTVESLTGLHIHHIVNVNFRGFREVVNTFKCFYADIDRTYFHSNVGVAPSQRYDAIDVKAGYQRMCGTDALDYVRFRHADSDLTRAARQQDFLRAAKDQIVPGDFLDDVKKFSRIARQYTQTDKNLRKTSGFISVAKLALNSVKLPVRQVEFPAVFAKAASGDGKTEVDIVQASPAGIASAVEKFLSGGGTQAKAARVVPKRKKDRGSVKKAQLVSASSAMQQVRSTLGRKRINSLGFSLMLPRYLTSQGRLVEGKDGARIYSIRDRDKQLHRAYRIVVTHNQLDGQYYGVQGTAWRNPPLLSDPSVTRTVKGRKLLLFRAGAKLRFVAWKTDRAAYWVSNTLNMKLSNAEMLALASSVKTSK